MRETLPNPFSDKDWIFEVKWDGFRAIAYIDEELSIKSRNEKELKHNFPELAELTQLANDLVVDGEIVVMKEGKPDFQSLAGEWASRFSRRNSKASQAGASNHTLFLIF